MACGYSNWDRAGDEQEAVFHVSNSKFTSGGRDHGMAFGAVTSGKHPYAFPAGGAQGVLMDTT